MDNSRLKTLTLLVYDELWKERNHRLLEESFRSPSLIAHEILLVLIYVM